LQLPTKQGQYYQAVIIYNQAVTKNFIKCCLLTKERDKASYSRILAEMKAKSL